MPSGLSGDGVSMWWHSTLGESVEAGSRYSLNIVESGCA